MSGGPHRYQQSPSYYRNSSRTPELHSFNSSDITSCSIESQARLVELNNEKQELKESLEFSECERQVLADSTRELKESLQTERNVWKKEQENLRKQITDLMAAKIKAESQLTRYDVEVNDLKLQMKKLNDDLFSKTRQIDHLTKDLESAEEDKKQLSSINEQLKLMLTEKLKYNGSSNQKIDNYNDVSDCVSIITEMAKLRLELNDKDNLIRKLSGFESEGNTNQEITNSQDIDNLNKFLDQTVECIKGWPEDIASSSHVQNLMKTLLSAYRVDQEDLNSRLENIHL